MEDATMRYLRAWTLAMGFLIVAQELARAAA